MVMGAFARLVLMAGVAAGLLACAAEPERTLSGIVPPARFEAGGVQAPRLSRWWTRFGSSEINRLVAHAEHGNFDIAAAAARIERADAQARVAGAALLPVLTGSLEQSRAQSSGTTGFGIRPPSRGNDLSGVLAASFELDVWGRNRDILRAALQNADATRYEREVIRLSTQGAVVNAWLQMVAARERLAIAGDNLANAQRVLRVISDRLRAGTGTALDLAQQESLVASLQAGIPSLRQTADTSRTALALLVGSIPEGFRVGGASLSALSAPTVPAGLPSAMLLRRPDVRAAESALAAADADVSAARKALLPSISLTGRGGYASSTLANLLRPESLLWSIAAGVAQPIFDGGALRAQVQISEAQRRELLENYRKAIISSFVDVENALIAVRENAAREAARRTAVAKAREAFRLAEQRLREGTIDLQTLLNAQSTLFQTEDSLLLDRLARLQASVSLFQALGGDVMGMP